jgi:hypothetical protein
MKNTRVRLSERLTAVSSPGVCVAAIDTGEKFLPALLPFSRGKPRLNKLVPSGGFPELVRVGTKFV